MANGRLTVAITTIYPFVGFFLLTLISNTSHVYAAEDRQNLRADFTLDFETGDLRGWSRTGTAFDYQPTLGDNPTARHRGQPSRHQGRYWIGGFEKFQGKPGQKPGSIQGDGPTGTLTSPSFTIPSGTLSFLIGGGGGTHTRAELLVSGQSALRTSGRNTETMHRVTWDLSPFAGRTGRIRIVDDASGGWGHINVDDFVFSSANLKTAVPNAMPTASPKSMSRKSPKPASPSAGIGDRDSPGETAKDDPMDDFSVPEDIEEEMVAQTETAPEEVPLVLPAPESTEEQRFMAVVSQTARDLRLGVNRPHRKSKSCYELVDSRYFAGLSLTKITGNGGNFDELPRMITGNPRTTLKTFTRDICEQMQKTKAASLHGSDLHYAVWKVEEIDVCYTLKGTKENIIENRARAIVNGEVELMTVSYPYNQKPLDAMEMMRVFVKNYRKSAK